MIGWIILGVIVGIITLIMLIPIGADVRYEEGVIRLSLKASVFKLQLIPKPKKADTEKKPKKRKKEKRKTSQDRGKRRICPKEKTQSAVQCGRDSGSPEDGNQRLWPIRTEIQSGSFCSSLGSGRLGTVYNCQGFLNCECGSVTAGTDLCRTVSL